MSQASERETVINWSKGEDRCSYYTCIKKEMRKMEKLMVKFPGEVVCLEKGKDSATYEYPSRWNVIRRPRTLSEEEVEKRRAAMKGRLEDMKERKENKQCKKEKSSQETKSEKPLKVKTEKSKLTTPSKKEKTASKEVKVSTKQVESSSPEEMKAPAKKKVSKKEAAASTEKQ